MSEVCPKCLQNPCYVSCLGPDELPPTYEELNAEVERLKKVAAIAEEFCQRVERGEVRSVRTYKAFREALKEPTE